MWRDDNDKLDDLLDNIIDKNISQYPATCPICGADEVNFYMHRYDEKRNRGGIWIWCSKCNHFSHFSIKIPEWWNNCNDISTEDLTSVPINLENKKELIWMHIKEIYRVK